MGQNLKMIVCSILLQSNLEWRERSTHHHTGPQSNGRIEGFHNFQKGCLSKHISRNREWDDITLLATASYNCLPTSIQGNHHFSSCLVEMHSQIFSISLNLNLGTWALDLILDLELMSNIYQVQIHKLARQRVIEDSETHT